MVLSVWLLSFSCWLDEHSSGVELHVVGAEVSVDFVLVLERLAVLLGVDVSVCSGYH